MDTPDAPPAPDPNVTAERAAQANRATAITQAGLNSTNQVTPYGNLTYEQIGTWPDGTPRYQATTSLSPGQQGLYDQQTQLAGGVNNLALNQVSRLTDLLGKPVNINNDTTESRLMQLGQARLDPIFQQRRSALETDLQNRGIMPGSEAYDRATAAFGRDQNDAYNQLLLSGRGQAVSEALAERNQPINEITALMSGGQVSQPNFVNTPQTNVAPTDVAGITNNAFQNQFANYNAQMQQNNAMMGGLFGLGGAALGAAGMGMGGWARGGFQSPFGR